jgi:carboxymethylenebutenolidase
MPDYIAAPTAGGPWPGVVLIHEAYGLVDDIRAKADRLASRGYLAHAVDLFDHGPRVACVLAAFRAHTFGKGPAFDEIEAARAGLAARDDCTGRVGVIGFCLGGGFALLSAPAFDVASANYAHLPRDMGILKGACPIVASYGGKDRTLRGTAAKLERTLDEYGVEHDVKEYPDASHSFLNQHTSGVPGVVARVSGMNYHGASAIDAWKRIDAFFDQHLKTS